VLGLGIVILPALFYASSPKDDPHNLRCRHHRDVYIVLTYNIDNSA
jgi:hypothetical protein